MKAQVGGTAKPAAPAKAAPKPAAKPTTTPTTTPGIKAPAGTPSKTPGNAAGSPGTKAPVAPPKLRFTFPGMRTKQQVKPSTRRRTAPEARVGLGFFEAVAAVDTSCSPQSVAVRGTSLQALLGMDDVTPQQDSHYPLWLLLVGIAGAMHLTHQVVKARHTKRRKKHAHYRIARIVGFAVATACIGMSMAPFFGGGILQAHAEGTVPLKQTYNGRLLDSSGNPISTAQTIRFSYWKSSDWVSSDTTGAGAINTSAANYAGWHEVQTVTFDSNGYFTLQIGNVVPLPDFSQYSPAVLTSLFLQVEVKPSAAANTSYELLDVNASSSIEDRSSVLSVPFSLNSDLLDLHDTGTGSGSIPVLQSGGLLPFSAVPGGTNRNLFIIDADHNATGEVTLEFGSLLQKTLKYDIANTRFTFNDDVRIEGGLTVTGLINGVDVANLGSATDALKVSSGGGLNLSILGGSYRLGGTTTAYAGGTSAVAANATNYVFFGSGGLTVRKMTFPTDESFIPLAVVTTGNGAVTGVTDRRVMQNDDREQKTELALTPEFPGASYVGDGSNNVGQLSILNDAVSHRNYYQWTSSRGGMQDYDVVLPFVLPANFVRWQALPLSFSYQSSSGDAAQNALDITVTDTAGSAVTLTGSGAGLANTAWTGTEIGFGGRPTWTAGGVVLIRMRLSAKSAAQMRLSDVKVRFVELKNN